MPSKVNSNDARRAGMQSGPARRERPAVVAYFNPGGSRPEDEAAAAGSDDAPVTDAGGGEHIYPDDIDDWAERFEVTPEQLRAAIRRVGAQVDAVERYLGNPDVV